MTGFERGDPVVERTTHCRDVHPILRATRHNASHEEGCSRMRTSTFVVVVLLSIIMAGPRFRRRATPQASRPSMPRCSSMSRRRLPIEPMCCAYSANAEVKAVAEKADLRRATTAVASLEPGVDQLADQARQVDEALAGGQSKVTISTTVIIIILLVILPSSQSTDIDQQLFGGPAAGVLLAVVVLLGEAEGAQSGRPSPSRRSIHLTIRGACGGAARRRWSCATGARGLDAESFAHLVDRSASGILQPRSSTTFADGVGRDAIAGTNEAIARELDDGRPILTLIEDRPGTFHYIVIEAGLRRGRSYHDPARDCLSNDESRRLRSPMVGGRSLDASLVVPMDAGVEHRHRRRS